MKKSRFKIGDKVIQIGKDYSISKKGWVGEITGIDEEYYAYVLFQKHPKRSLDVDASNLELIRDNNYIVYKSRNTPAAD